jgi:hypothetical protein
MHPCTVRVVLRLRTRMGLVPIALRIPPKRLYRETQIFRRLRLGETASKFLQIHRLLGHRRAWLLRVAYTGPTLSMLVDLLALTLSLQLCSGTAVANGLNLELLILPA